MKYLEKYTGEKTYMYPNAALATPERVLTDFPASLAFAHIVETDVNGEVMFGMYNLSAMRTQYGIDASLTEAEAIQAIQDIMNTPEPEPEETVDESTVALQNIAAQLEFQNMMALDDATTEGTV
ncbi:MAG: hypothetical protein ACI4WY_04640 [Anaerovoracaceae bacterium]